MYQKRKLIIIIFAIVLLIGLIVLAANLDTGYKKDPSEGSSGASEGTQQTGKDKWAVTYEEYLAMTGVEQEAFYYSFDNSDDYFKWYNAAKKEYDSNENNIVIGGDNSVNLGDILNGNK